MELETTKPHVAILPSPGMGHIIPLLELATRLVTHHGFFVTFPVIQTVASTGQSHLLRSSFLPDDLRLVDIRPVDVSPFVPDDAGILTRLWIIVQESLPSILSTIADMPRKPTILVVDIFCTDVFDIAGELHIPKYTFFTSSAKLLAFMLHLPSLDREVEGVYIDLPEPVRVPGCDPIRTDDLIDKVRNRKIDEYKWCLHHSSRLTMADGIFVNTSDDLEPTSLRALSTPRVYPVGPVIKVDKQIMTSENECMTSLYKQPSDSVLFVSLGSGGTLSVEQVTELAWGLELSQQRFVWLVRKPTIEAKASGTYFNVGGERNNPADYLPDGFLERTRHVGLVVPSWAPQMEVLSHVSTGGFLSTIPTATVG